MATDTSENSDGPRAERPTNLAGLGFSSGVEAALARCLRAESGVVLLVGQRGSGLTTTSYAALRELARTHGDRGGGAIVSVEDPIEEVLAGVEQLAVDAKVGFASSDAIDEAARRNPAVISTGVLVDRQCVEKVFEHAKAGRLVIAILWGLAADEAVERLVEMGIARDDLTRHLLGIFVHQIVDDRVLVEHTPEAHPGARVTQETATALSGVERENGSPLSMTMPSTRKWGDAARVLAADPSRTVRCPERDDGVLRVHDEVFNGDPAIMERYLVCETCGARNVLRMRVPEGSG